MSKRIWNEEELKSIVGFSYLSFLGWRKSSESFYLLSGMIGKTIEYCKEHGYHLEDWMIATTEDKPQTQNNMKTSVTLNNGTLLEVGKKYRLKHHLIGEFVEVKCIDEDIILVRDYNDVPTIYALYLDWLPYTAPQEEVKWKTFLIEMDWNGYTTKELLQFKSLELAKKHYSNAISITEVEIEIKEVK